VYPRINGSPKRRLLYPFKACSQSPLLGMPRESGGVQTPKQWFAGCRRGRVVPRPGSALQRGMFNPRFRGCSMKKSGATLVGECR
jgi:hypothetical protein